MKLGVLSDFHGNCGALRRGISLLAARGAERLVALGDAVGYVPTLSVLRYLRQNNIFCLRGNHEAMLLAGGLPDARDEIYRFQETAAQLNADDLAWLRALPPSHAEVVDGRRLLFVHGSPTDPVYGYVYPDTDLAPLVPSETDVVFMGNTHHPFVRRHGACMFVNVGSCGLPRDPVALGCVAIFDTESCAVELVRFPIGDTAAEVMKEHRLHESVAAIYRRCIDEDGKRARH